MAGGLPASVRPQQVPVCRGLGVTRLDPCPQ